MSLPVWVGCMAVVSGISLPLTTFPVSVLKIHLSGCALPILPLSSLLLSMPHPRKYPEFSLVFKLIGTTADGSVRYSAPAALRWVKNMSARASTSLSVQ